MSVDTHAILYRTLVTSTEAKIGIHCLHDRGMFNLQYDVLQRHKRIYCKETMLMMMLMMMMTIMSVPLRTARGGRGEWASLQAW